MPMAILEAYSKMLSRLQAEEALLQITTAITGSGFSGDSGKDTIKSLERQAKGLPPLKPEEDTKYPGRAFAAYMGMPIKVHQKKKPVVEGA